MAKSNLNYLSFKSKKMKKMNKIVCVTKNNY